MVRRTGRRHLPHWQVLELISWCQAEKEIDDKLELDVIEIPPNKILFSAHREGLHSYLQIDLPGCTLEEDPGSMSPESAADLWKDVLLRAIEGKVEKAVHHGYMRCRICAETVWIPSAPQIEAHLEEHQLNVTALPTENGLEFRLGKEVLPVSRFFTPEDHTIQ